MKLKLATLVAAAIVGCNAAPHWDGKLTDKIPEPVRTALEEAQEFELLSLDPKHRDSDKPSEFFRRKVIGKMLITDAETRTRILGALDAGVRPDGGMTAPPDCFDPRHAIRVQRDGKTFYLTICFHCEQVEVFVDDKLARPGFLTTGAPEPVFDEVLRAAGVPLAEKAMLQDELEHNPSSN